MYTCKSPYTFLTNSAYKNNLCISSMPLLVDKNMHHSYKRQRVSLNSDLEHREKRKSTLKQNDPHKTTEFLSRWLTHGG